MELQLDALLAEGVAAGGDHPGHVVVAIEGLVADLAPGETEPQSALIHANI